MQMVTEIFIQSKETITLISLNLNALKPLQLL